MIKKQNPIQRILTKKDSVIILFNYKIRSGRKIFCFLETTRAKQNRLMMELKKGGNVPLAEYGRILDFGLNEPSESQIADIKATYS